MIRQTVSRLALPMCSGQRAPDQNPPLVSSMSAFVHVVDDDPSFRASVGRLLRACGYAVETYEFAEQLLQRLPDDPGPGCLLINVLILC